MISATLGATARVPLSNDAGRQVLSFITANGPNMTVTIDKDAGMTMVGPLPTAMSLTKIAALGGAALLVGLVLGRVTR